MGCFYLSEPPDQTSFPNSGISNQNLKTNKQEYEEIIDVALGLILQ